MGDAGKAKQRKKLGGGVGWGGGRRILEAKVKSFSAEET